MPSKQDFNELTIAPSFKDLLQAVVEEKRVAIKNSDFYRYVDKSIRNKCEEAARNLKEKISLQDLSTQLISNDIFKALGAKFGSEALSDTIKCVCKDLGLEYKDGVISWE